MPDKLVDPPETYWNPPDGEISFDQAIKDIEINIKDHVNDWIESCQWLGMSLPDIETRIKDFYPKDLKELYKLKGGESQGVGFDEFVNRVADSTLHKIKRERAGRLISLQATMNSFLAWRKMGVTTDWIFAGANKIRNNKS